jgi:hypothetical protein
MRKALSEEHAAAAVLGFGSFQGTHRSGSPSSLVTRTSKEAASDGA